jgi:ribosomal-protein-serine acetyltransferase
VKVNPLMIDFPHELYTERLHIRMPMPGDGRVVWEAIRASQTELREWMLFAQVEQTEADVEAVMRDSHTQFLLRKELQLLIFQRETGQLIGSSGLHRINWDVRKFEIGYWIDTRHRGQGYMTEAVKAISDFAFDELLARRVEIRCDKLNLRSRAIPERLGFELEGILRHDDIAMDGQRLRDTCIYSMIR